MSSVMNVARIPESAGRSDSRALMLLCPVCGCDAGEPVGMVAIAADEPDATIAIRCSGCSTIYLTPDRAGPDPVTSKQATTILTPSRLRRWSRRLGPGAKVLHIESDDRPSAEREPSCAEADRAMDVRPARAAEGKRHSDLRGRPAWDDGGYDLILLPLTLESAKSPTELMRRVGLRLRRGGRAVILVCNTDSCCFRAFGGRHWSGYRPASARQHFNPAALERLCTGAGLRVASVQTHFYSGGWLTSIAAWLRDWGAKEWAVRLLTGGWGVPQALASCIEGFATLLGRGSLLGVVVMRDDRDH